MKAILKINVEEGREHSITQMEIRILGIGRRISAMVLEFSNSVKVGNMLGSLKMTRHPEQEV
jgi:hypothetical protein